MPERTQRRKLRRDPPEDQDLLENSNSSKVENKVSKRLRDTEHCHREIIELIENLSTKVDNLTNSSSLEPGCSGSETETHVNSRFSFRIY